MLPPGPGTPLPLYIQYSLYDVQLVRESVVVLLLVSIRREQNPQLGAEKVPTWGQNDRVYNFVF